MKHNETKHDVWYSEQLNLFDMCRPSEDMDNGKPQNANNKQDTENFMSQKKLMTTKELAEYLGIGINAAYTLLRSKGFPGIRLGKKKYVTREAVDEWLDAYKGKTFVMEER